MASASSGAGFPSFVHTGTICGLAVKRSGIENEFGEDRGRIVAITPEGHTASVQVRTLTESVNYFNPALEDSLSEKVAFLEILRRMGPLARPVILLERSFTSVSEEDSGKGASESSKKRRIHSSAKVASDVVAQIFTPFENPPSPMQSAGLLRVDSAVTTFANQSRDFKLAATLYDMIKEILSYSPADATPALDRSSYLQIIPNGIPISLGKFAEKPPISPLNPQGDMTTTEEFSSLASMIFDLDGRKIDKSVEKAYESIIHGADSTQPLDRESVAILERVRSYLFSIAEDPYY